MPSHKELWAAEHERLAAELADRGLSDAEAHDAADRLGETINDRVRDHYAGLVDAAKDHAKYRQPLRCEFCPETGPEACAVCRVHDGAAELVPLVPGG